MDAALSLIWTSLVSFAELVQRHIFPVFRYPQAKSMRADCLVQPILICVQQEKTKNDTQ